MTGAGCRPWTFYSDLCFSRSLCCAPHAGDSRVWLESAGWRVHGIGRPGSEHRRLPPPVTRRDMGAWGTPSTAPQQHVSQGPLVHRLVSQRLGDKVPRPSKALGAWMGAQLQLQCFPSPPPPPRLPAWPRNSGKSRTTACTWRKSRRTTRSPSRTCRPRWRRLSSWPSREGNAPSRSWKPGWGQHRTREGKRRSEGGLFPPKVPSIWWGAGPLIYFYKGLLSSSSPCHLPPECP